MQRLAASSMALAHARLGDALFDETHAEGRLMQPDEVLARLTVLL